LPRVWRVSQQPLSEQPVTAVTADKPLLKQLKPDLLALSVAEPVIQIQSLESVSQPSKNKLSDHHEKLASSVSSTFMY